MRKCVIGLILLVMLATLTLVGSTSITQAQPPGDTVQIIVKFKASDNSNAVDAAAQASGGKALRDLPQLRIHIISVPARAADNVLAAFAHDPSVERATKAVKFHKAGTPDDPLYPQQWALPKIAWDQVYGTDNIDGSAIIAVLDTGVDAGHPDLAGRMGSGQSFVNGDSNSDPNGHGTALAGIAAANVNNAVGVAGVAYARATVSSVQVLQPDGTGLDSDVIAGVVWAVDNGAKVILMGFSSADYSAALADALQYAWSKGAVLVAATGNDSSSAPSYPAGMENVLGVASTDQNDNVAADSNTGSACVAAPGVDIYTTNPSGNYGSVSGTSAAAANVAGLAVLLAANGQSNDYIYDQIRGAVDPIAGQSFGRINIATAMGEAVIPPPSPTPTPPPEPGPTPPEYKPANKNLTVTFAGTGSGSVALVDNNDSSKNGTHTSTFTIALGNNDAGTLTATASGGSTFIGWSSAGSGFTGYPTPPNPCSYNMNNSAQSITATFTLANPVPTTTSISPTTKTVGDALFTLTVNGTNFIVGSVVRFNGSSRTTTYVNGTRLTATILASDLISVGTFPITVFNPTPGGGVSNAQTFTVEAVNISFTVTDYGGDGIKFGSLDPGMTDSPADQTPTQGAVTLTIGVDTNVAVNVQIRGNNFSSGPGNIPIGNVKYNNSNITSGASTMQTTYVTWYTAPARTGDTRQCYHWISIPAGQPPGAYISTFYYQATQ